MKCACSKMPRAARTSRFPAEAASAQWRHPDTKAAVSSSPHLPVWRPVCLCSGDHSLLTLIFYHSPQCFDSDPSPHHHSAPPPYHITNTGTTFFFFLPFPFFWLSFLFLPRQEESCLSRGAISGQRSYQSRARCCWDSVLDSWTPHFRISTR